MKIIFLLVVYTSINAVPIKQTVENKMDTTVSNKEKSDHVTDIAHRNITNNDLSGESRAGIIDEINPFNKQPNKQQPQANNNNDGQNTNNPLAAIQNLFANAPHLFNGTNFSSQPGGNFLDNVKIFLIGTQGIVMPASSILGGFQNLMQTLGNMGNLNQLPSLPLGK